MEMSPRLSFSSDLPPSPISRLDHSLPLEPPSDEFDFTTSFEVSTPADLLFSQGRLLPLLHNNSSKSNNTSIDSAQPPPPKNQTLRQILAMDHHHHHDSVASCSSSSSSSSSNTAHAAAQHPSSFWHAFARSSSASAVSSNKTGTGPFPRSKSAGCNPDRSRNQDAGASKFWKLPPRGSSSSSPSSSSNSNAKAYYYSGDRRVSNGNNGVRISPVINLPAPFIPRGGSSNSNSNSSSSVGVGGSTSSFFAYLLCSCGDKTMEAKEVEKGSLAAASL